MLWFLALFRTVSLRTAGCRLLQFCLLILLGLFLLLWVRVATSFCSLLFAALCSLGASQGFLPWPPTFAGATFWGSLGSYSLVIKASSAFRASLKALIFLAKVSVLRPITLEAVADGGLLYLTEGRIRWSL